MKLFKVNNIDFSNIGIYKITNPKGKVYIGQSKNIKKRIKRYKQLNCKIQRKLFKSLCKYGYKNHTFEILQFCSLNELNNLERYYQNEYNVLGKNGLNCYLTESDIQKRKLSKKTKNKISKSLKGRIPINRIKVICTKTNIIYKSIKDCATKNNIGYSTLKNKLQGRFDNNTTYKYYYEAI